MAANSIMTALAGLHVSVPTGFDTNSLTFAAPGLYDSLPWEVHPLKHLYYISATYPFTLNISGVLVDVTGAIRADLLGYPMTGQSVDRDGVYYDPVASTIVRSGDASNTAFARVVDSAPQSLQVITDISGAKILAEYNGRPEHAALLDRLRELLVSGVQAAARPGTKANPGFLPSIGTEQDLRAE